ncbi:BTB/POZ domain-containing protein [Phthorimaea operculella]|nr:BTB/POZ domain-containing protein [Phthorimaea operculella]
MSSRVTGTCCTASVERAGLPGLLRDLQRLSEDQDSADIVFILGTAEEKIYAHRIILVARCKSFQNTKRGEICRIPGCSVSAPPAGATGTPVPIRMPHVQPDTFRLFIQYVYTGKLLLQDSGVFEMMTLAADLGVEDLRAACEDHVTSTLSVESACTLLAAAMEIQDRPGGKCASSFMERCIAFIGDNAADCVKSNAFLNLPKEALIKLISSDFLCLEEEEVWRCALAWAKQRAGVTQPTAHWTEEERARVNTHLAPLMTHVRLLLIDSTVFAEEVEPTGAVPMELSLERYRRAALLAAPTNSRHDDKRTTPRLAVNMFAGSVILQQDKSAFQAVINNCFREFTVPSWKFVRIKSVGDPAAGQERVPGSHQQLFLRNVAILQQDKSAFQAVINNWCGTPKQCWQLIFRASTHGYSAAAFHAACDGAAPVLVIVWPARGAPIGGFSEVPWTSGGAAGYLPADRAFLFSLADPPAKYPLVKKPVALCYHPDCEPAAGQPAPASLAPDYNFTVRDYEVFTYKLN